jgi:hypothetical protein
MLTPLEESVLNLLLLRPGEPYETIRRQLSHATVTKREFTGVGFFTEFAVPEDAPVERDLSDATLGDVAAESPSLKHGVGFVLFVRNGVVSMLEGYTYDEDWPVSVDDFALFRCERG